MTVNELQKALDEEMRSIKNDLWDLLNSKDDMEKYETLRSIEGAKVVIDFFDGLDRLIKTYERQNWMMVCIQYDNVKNENKIIKKENEYLKGSVKDD